jgi:hypothetical protein
MATALAKRQEQYALAVRLANDGVLLKEICVAIGVEPNTLSAWQANDAIFRAAFSQAREAGLHLLADGLVKLPDDYPDVNKARLKSDNIKWLLARRLSRQYGDRLDVNVSGVIDLGSTLIEARRRSEQPVCNQLDAAQSQVIDAAYELVAQPTDKESAPGEPDIFS